MEQLEKHLLEYNIFTLFGEKETMLIKLGKYV
mgnify:CR=1 FL=1